MEGNCRIRFRRSDLEIEIQGDREFVETHFNRFLQRFRLASFEGAEICDDVLNRLLDQKHPHSHSQKVLLFAYYLVKYKKADAFCAEDIGRCYQEARIAQPRNINDLIRKLPREYVMEAGRKGKKKAWRLTREGMTYVESIG